MKTVLLLLLWCPLVLFAQDEDVADSALTGVWTGHLYNDTTHQYIPYELAISLNRGKLNGYSHTIFFIDSIANIGVKNLSVRRKEDEVIIEDRKLIDDNYTEPPAKGVRTTLRLVFSENDTAFVLSGTWSTNATRKYNPLTGTVFLIRRKDIEKTKIIPRLVDLDLGQKLSFVSPEMLAKLTQRNYLNTQSLPQRRREEIAVNEEPVMTVVEPELVISLPLPKDSGKRMKLDYTGLEIPSDSGAQASPGPKEIKREVTVVAPPVAKVLHKSTGEKNQEKKKEKSKSPEPSRMIAPKEIIPQKVAPKVESDSSRYLPIAIGTERVEKTRSNLPLVQDSAKTIEAKAPKPGDNLPAKQKQEENQKTLPVQKNQKEVLVVEAPLKEVLKKTAQQQPAQPVVTAAEDLEHRKVETIRTVEITEDSLVFTLYDNGAVDGDTVSVLLNGEVIMPRVGLSVVPHTKTIKLTPEMGDSIKVIMYAENLGSIPPNTGLLIIREGDKYYQIRFSGDLKKNSAIILTRKRKP